MGHDSELANIINSATPETLIFSDGSVQNKVEDKEEEHATGAAECDQRLVGDNDAL